MTRVLKHPVSALRGEVGMILEQGDETATVLFQFGDKPWNQATAQIPICDLELVKAVPLTLWQAPEAEPETAPDCAPLVFR